MMRATFIVVTAAVLRRNETAVNMTAPVLTGAAAEADAHATGAEAAAHAAQTAARVANEVASHATPMHAHSQDALKHAHAALHSAQADTAGMSDSQKESLDKADAALKKASEKMETEELEQEEWVKEALDESEAQIASRAATERLRQQIKDLEKQIAEAKEAKEREAYQKEIDRLKKELEAQVAAENQAHGTAESLGKMKDELDKMQRQLETMEDIKQLKGKLDGKTDDMETKELLDKMKEIDDLLTELEKQKKEGADISPETQEALEEELRKLKVAVAERIEREEEAEKAAAAAAKEAATTDAEKEFPDGSQMPYGQLAPFGRENVAEELTEASIRESNKMVDDIESAEVAEEKRAVFRALTRLRGAAITSYDGVARSQTGNIAEYNHQHKWRDTHPLQHLATEESDVSKWAFPETAD
jgi:chromosome segregation ATPase